MTRFGDLPPDFDPPTFDLDAPTQQTDTTDYDEGWRDGIQAAAAVLDTLADALTNRGDEYKAAIVEQCVWVIRKGTPQATTAEPDADIWGTP